MNTHKYTDVDYPDVIKFLGSLYQLDKDKPYWLPARWEYATYLVSPLHLDRGDADWKEYINIWKDKEKIIGVANSESPNNNVFIHIHPEYKDFEEELIKWAEDNIANESIKVWSLESDTKRTEILRKKGYKKLRVNEYLNWRNLGEPIPKVVLPKSYQFKSFQDGFDLNSRNMCASLAFKSKPVPKEVYCIMQTAPSYNPDLDLVVVDGNDTVVSLCTIWYDKHNNIAYIEPVATHPNYQKKGLGKAILNEGLRRLKELNVEIAYVGAYADWRKAFYYSSGFNNSVLLKPWRKMK